MIELVRRLTETTGVSGFEDDIRAVIRDEVAGLVDETRIDALGNLVVLRRGRGGTGARRVMLAAHMDQIGVMVSFVDAQGYLRVTAVGGLRPLACVGSQVRFVDGTVGTIGLDGRIDARSHVPTIADLYLDVGATSRSEVRQTPGDAAAFWQAFAAQSNAWFAPNLDDRIGCAVLIELLRAMVGIDIAHDVYVVFTAQEEIGARGAVTSAFAIRPDVALAVDVTLTGDTPHARPAMAVSLGAGPAIKVQDSGMISHRGLNRLLQAAAKAAGVPYQLEALQAGTTDAEAMQLAHEGVPASCISVPCRHMHTPSQIVDRRDAEGAVSLLLSFVSGPIEL